MHNIPTFCTPPVYMAYTGSRAYNIPTFCTPPRIHGVHWFTCVQHSYFLYPPPVYMAYTGSRAYNIPTFCTPPYTWRTLVHVRTTFLLSVPPPVYMAYTGSRAYVLNGQPLFRASSDSGHDLEQPVFLFGEHNQLVVQLVEICND